MQDFGEGGIGAIIIDSIVIAIVLYICFAILKETRINFARKFVFLKRSCPNEGKAIILHICKSSLILSPAFFLTFILIEVLVVFTAGFFSIGMIQLAQLGLHAWVLLVCSILLGTASYKASMIGRDMEA